MSETRAWKRWEARHPERAARLNRRRAAKTARTLARLRERHRDEYEALRAEQDPALPRWERRRLAERALRDNHRSEYDEIRAQVREEMLP